MAKYIDSTGAEIINPDLSAGTLTPKETVHHDAVAAVTHREERELPGGLTIKWTVVDKPAQPEWDEPTVYLYTPNPPTAEQTRLDEQEAAIAELGDMVAGKGATDNG